MKGLLPMYKGYQAKVEFSVEDSLLVGEVIGVADYLSFHAESVREVEDMFHQCIDGYLAFCREAGKTPEKAYRGSFNVRIPPELHRAAVIGARASGGYRSTSSSPEHWNTRSAGILQPPSLSCSRKNIFHILQMTRRAFASRFMSRLKRRLENGPPRQHDRF